MHILYDHKVSYYIIGSRLLGQSVYIYIEKEKGGGGKNPLKL